MGHFSEGGMEAGCIERPHKGLAGVVGGQNQKQLPTAASEYIYNLIETSEPWLCHFQPGEGHVLSEPEFCHGRLLWRLGEGGLLREQHSEVLEAAVTGKRWADPCRVGGLSSPSHLACSPPFH